MKFSYNWLREYYNFKLEPDELAKLITFGGIEVESINAYPEDLAQVKVVKIISTKEHPNADKLNVCQIDDGENIREVVCGAPNCKADMLTAYAPIGTVVAGNIIEERELRGVVSDGMLCSEKELGLIKDGPRGIMEIPQSVKLGISLADYLSIEDTVFEVEVTPNRPDLLGIIGIARDIVALTGDTIKLSKNYPTTGLEYPFGNLVVGKGKESLPFALTNEEPELCPRYIAKVIKGITVKESPEWLKNRLLTVGITPINNVVDITNYVMLEFGHPLHAFDYDLLKGHQIKIRKATQNEEVEALDHKKYILGENDLVIADEFDTVAIAGVIGSQHSAITEKTVNIVLEAANFHYLSVRNTAHKLKITTDSAYRFERNLSDETAAIVSDRATSLILEICGGEIDRVIESFPKPFNPNIVKLRTSRTNQILTTKLKAEDIISYLAKIGLQLIDSDNENLLFQIPAYRKDLAREIDLIEEVIRLYGYNNIDTGNEKTSLMNRDWLVTKRQIADYLVHRGFYEAINSSFIEYSLLKALNLQDNDYRLNCWELKNPLGSSFSLMRTTLLPGLFKNANLNVNNGQEDLKLFELGKTYLKESGKPVEKFYLSAIISGNKGIDHWKYKNDKENIYTVKGYIETLLQDVIGGDVVFNETDAPYLQNGLSLEINFNGYPIGYIGKIDPFVANKFELEITVFAIEIDLDKMMEVKEEKKKNYQEINRYPTVDRDISFIVKKDHSFSEISKTIHNVDTEHIKSCYLIDEFTGKSIRDGYRSLTFRLDIGAKDRTLTDEFINALISRAIEKLKNLFEIEMR